MTTQSGRKFTPMDRLIPVMTAEITAVTRHEVEVEIFCYQAIYLEGTQLNNRDPLMSYKATSDPGTMYPH